MTLDMLISGGTVVDGTGGAARTADIGIVDGRIVSVGTSLGSAQEVIDADGALVTPGWVDAHTHYDAQSTWDADLEGSAAHGVTTAVMGNCGVGFAPAPPASVDVLIDMMAGVEGIAPASLREGMPWGSWDSFPSYLQYLGGQAWSLDLAAQLPHGALRVAVLRDRALEVGELGDDDLAALSSLTEEALHAGAVGFSTSRILQHRSLSGHCVPGTFAADRELVAIAEGMSRGGGGVFQAVVASSTGTNLELDPRTTQEEVRRLGHISRTFGLPATFSMLQIHAEPDEWRVMLETAVDENRHGADVRPMCAARGVTNLTSLDGHHLFLKRPTYRRLASLALAQRVVAMRQPDVKAAILAEDDDGTLGAGSDHVPAMLARNLDRTFALDEPLDYEPSPDRSIESLAREQGRDPEAFMYDFLLGADGRAVAVAYLANYAAANLDAIREMLESPITVSGLSDAGAHVDRISDMSMATFQLAHWARDRARGPKLSVEHLVAKSTSAPARLYGFDDRGTIEVGRRADINVIDLPNLHVLRPELRADLPGGGVRYVQGAIGYLATLVKGVLTRRYDEDTGARPGRLVT